MGDDDGEIRSLLARLVLNADSGTLEEYGADFAEDAVWALPAVGELGVAANDLRGRNDILAGARERREAGVQGPGTFTRHVVTTTEIKFVDDKRATARSVFMIFRQTATQPALSAMGQYDDTVVKASDGWKLARRTITFG